MATTGENGEHKRRPVPTPAEVFPPHRKRPPSRPPSPQKPKQGPEPGAEPEQPRPERDETNQGGGGGGAPDVGE